MAKRAETEQTPKGLEVSVPKRGEFFANLKKIVGGKPTPAPKPNKP